jgi:serine/threonine protein kinase
MQAFEGFVRESGVKPVTLGGRLMEKNGGLSPNAIDLVQKMLRPNPSERIPSQEALPLSLKNCSVVCLALNNCELACPPIQNVSIDSPLSEAVL